MPMIEFRYNRKKISDEQAQSIGSGLEAALRDAIASLGRQKEDYGVTVEGDPFGLIAHNQPDLRVYVFYHEDWAFTAVELARLPEEIKVGVLPLLIASEAIGISVKIRCYCRTGPASASIP